MGSYFNDIYLKRLNRNGRNEQQRLQSKREKYFLQKLSHSVYRVEFKNNGKICVGDLEPNKQDETKVMQNLLTPTDVQLFSGDIVVFYDKYPEVDPAETAVNVRRFMVWYQEDIKASGYNKYIMIKMTHFINWTDREKKKRHTWAYFYGQEDNQLKDELKSRSRNNGLYNENLKLSYIVMPTNAYFNRDDYFEITAGDWTEAYRVTGYDRISTPGVEYVSVDPEYIRDNTPAPKIEEEKDPKKTEDDFFWVSGGE